MTLPHVVIIGGGFGGLYAARALRRARVRITILDRRNHHVFQPLLYQVAMAALSPGDIASPIRWILRRQKNVEVLLAEVRAIDQASQQLILADGAAGDGETLSYDYLIVASGATHAYFGHDEWRATAPGLKTLEDALDIRRRVLLAFERAEREADPRRRERLLTFVVIGGGPTGVEMAGALAEISRQSLARDFRHIDPSSARIILIEAGPSVLSTFPEPLREAARADLTRLGVDVRTGAAGHRRRARAVAVGLRDHRGRDGHLGRGRRRLAARGDARRSARPGRARSRRAGSDGPRLAHGVRHRRSGHARGRRRQAVAGCGAGRDPDGEARGAQRAAGDRAAALPSVRLHDLGNMATIGRASAVADFGWLRLKGYLGWLAWLFVHILNLIGFRNRLRRHGPVGVVLLQLPAGDPAHHRPVAGPDDDQRPTAGTR